MQTSSSYPLYIPEKNEGEEKAGNQPSVPVSSF